MAGGPPQVAGPGACPAPETHPSPHTCSAPDLAHCRSLPAAARPRAGLGPMYWDSQLRTKEDLAFQVAQASRVEPRHPG